MADMRRAVRVGGLAAALALGAAISGGPAVGWADTTGAAGGGAEAGDADTASAANGAEDQGADSGTESSPSAQPDTDTTSTPDGSTPDGEDDSQPSEEPDDTAVISDPDDTDPTPTDAAADDPQETADSSTDGSTDAEPIAAHPERTPSTSSSASDRAARSDAAATSAASAALPSSAANDAAGSATVENADTVPADSSSAPADTVPAAATVAVDTPTATAQASLQSPAEDAVPQSAPVEETVAVAQATSLFASLFGSPSGDAPLGDAITATLLAAARRVLGFDDEPALETPIGVSTVAAAAAGPQPGLDVVGSVTTGGGPSDVAVSGDRIFVTNQADGTMTVLRRSDNAVLATVPVSSPSAVVVSAARSRAYVANADAGTVTVIDTTTYATVRTIRVGANPTALALTPDGRRLLVVNTGSGSITKINTSNNIVTMARVRVGNAPSSVAVSADGKTAYVTNAGDGTVSAITLSWNNVKTIANVGVSPSDVLVDGSTVYVSTLDGKVVSISASSRKVIGEFAVGTPVRSIALSADGANLLAATTADSLVRINLATGLVASPATTDPSPDTVSTPSLAVADDGTIYQTDATDDAVRILRVPPNQAPSISDPVVGAPDPQSGVVTGSIVASDANGDGLKYAIGTRPAYGVVTLNGAAFTYKPSAHRPSTVTEDTFVIAVTDGTATSTSTVRVSVPPNTVVNPPMKTGTYQFQPPVWTMGVSSTAEYSQRKLLDFPVEPAKLRIHLGNYNLLADTMVSRGALDDINLWIGEAELGPDGKPTGAFVPGTQVQIPIAPTLASGQWGISDWVADGQGINFDPTKQYLLSYGFGTPGGELDFSSGGASSGWMTREAGDAGLDLPAGLAATPKSYLNVWVEYQYVDEGQPSIFVVSNSSAWNLSGAKGSEWDTWVNQWAEKSNGVVAGNISSAGAWTTYYDTPGERWDFYDNQLEIPLDPDYVVYMATNASDAWGDWNSSQLKNIQNRTLAMVAVGQQRFPNALQVLTDIPPREGFWAGTERERLALNAWMSTLPGGADIYLPLSDLLSNGGNPARQKPEYSADGTHWTPAGIAAVVALMISDMNPVTPESRAAIAVTPQPAAGVPPSTRSADAALIMLSTGGSQVCHDGTAACLADA